MQSGKFYDTCHLFLMKFYFFNKTVTVSFPKLLSVLPECFSLAYSLNYMG